MIIVIITIFTVDFSYNVIVLTTSNITSITINTILAIIVISVIATTMLTTMTAADTKPVLYS